MGRSIDFLKKMSAGSTWTIDEIIRWADAANAAIVVCPQISTWDRVVRAERENGGEVLRVWKGHHLDALRLDEVRP